MIASKLRRPLFITYLKLGYLLHIMTIAEVVGIIACFRYFHLIHWMQEGNVYLKSFLVLCLVFPPVFPICDARSRFQNYKQVKDQLYTYGFQFRIIKPFMHSRCQRDAVLAAAEELGMEQECKDFFYSQGYRWFHVIPDFMISDPSYLLQKAFWLNTFFAKYYAPKIDYSGLNDIPVSKGTIGSLIANSPI